MNRATLGVYLLTLAASLALAAQPSQAAWHPVDYLYNCEDSLDGSRFITVMVLEKVGDKLTLVPRTAARTSSHTTDGHVTVKTELYSIVQYDGKAVHYNCSVDGLATLDAWIVLERVPGTRPGPAPLTWTQRAYCNTEWHHRIQYISGGGYPPGGTYYLEWHSTARALDATPQKKSHWHNHEEGNFSNVFGWLHALSQWKKHPTTEWLRAGVVHSALVANCALENGQINMEADHFVVNMGTPPCWGAEYK